MYWLDNVIRSFCIGMLFQLCLSFSCYKVLTKRKNLDVMDEDTL
jgi:hypothetical protein